MPDSRWDTLQQLFLELLPLDPTARATRLTALAATDAALAGELEALLRAADAPANPLDTPIAGAADVDPLLAAEGPFRAGARVGPYTLVRLVGEGGMGWVWLAERADGTLTRSVALKLPKWTWSFPDLTARLARERDILASLEHANIARLYDAGVDDHGRPYLAMEYVEGEPIDVYCRTHALPLDARLQVLLQVARAVAYAHSRLVVHRDLKPGNIVVAGDGSVRLLDFGIATLLDSAATTRAAHARPGTRIFTPRYAAPEQITGGAIGTPTDVYALGVVLYELLTGASPYRAGQGGPAQLEAAIVAGDTRLASAAAEDRAVARRLRGDLDAILNKALKANPAERYASVHALADDLERFLRHDTVSARPDSVPYRVRTFARRHRVGVAAAAVVAATFAGATAYSLRQAGIAERERDRAVQALGRAEAVGEFYHFLLADAGPPDAPLTINGMIERSQGLLDTEFAGQPALQAAVLVVQSSYYLGQSNAALGVPLANRAAELAAGTGDADLIAEAACLRGYGQSLTGQPSDGIRTIEAALADPTLSPGTSSACHAQRAYVAQNAGDGAAAAMHARAALDDLRRDRRTRPRSEALMLGDLAYAQQLLGRLGDAHQSFAASFERLQALKLEWTPVAGTILNNWAIAVLAAGDVKRALELWERAAAVVRARDAGAPLPVFLLANLGRAYELSGRFDDAARIYDQTTAAARASKRVEIIAYGLNGSATVRLQQGRLDEAEALLADTRAVTDTLAPAAPARANADVLAARLAMARGRRQDAWDAFERLRQLYDAQPPGAGAASVRVMLADAALALGRADEAARLAGESLTRATALQAGMPYSRAVGLAHFALARARAAQGRTSDARAESAAALDHFTHAVGDDHPTVREIRQFQASLPAPRP
jgi:eukaryotic-like serine/threonine-protein kinase